MKSSTRRKLPYIIAGCAVLAFAVFAVLFIIDPLKIKSIFISDINLINAVIENVLDNEMINFLSQSAAYLRRCPETPLRAAASSAPLLSLH